MFVVRPPLRRLIVAFAVIVGGATATACSSHTTAQEALDELHLSDDPKVVVATAIERVDPRSPLGAELAADYLHVKFALRGYSWADAGCAVERARSVVTADALAALPVGRLDDLAFDHPGLETDLRVCASPASLARLDVAPNATSTTVKTEPLPNAAPDIDGATVRRMTRGFYALTSKALGLTSKERDCAYRAVFGDRTDAQLVDVLLGRIPTSIEASADRVAACLTEDRFDQVTATAAKQLLARQKAVKAEHERVQALLDASVAPTVPATTAAPATTAVPTVPPTTGN